jgi:microfibrillar-associated protein 1
MRHFANKYKNEEESSDEENIIKKNKNKNRIDSDDEEEKKTKKEKKVYQEITINKDNLKIENKKINKIITEYKNKHIITNEEEEEESEEEENDEENDSEEEILKPVFIPKSNRDTIFEKQQMEEEEQRYLELQKEKKEEQIQETRKKIFETEKEKEDEEKSELPNDETIDEFEERKQWKTREYERTQREIKERNQRKYEQEEVERRRNLTSFERKKEDEEDALNNPIIEKSQPKFMQKYYHSGSYFHHESEKDERMKELLSRDFNAPTLEDKYNKIAMPKVMQARGSDFGKKGRTKYTHLVDQDTTYVDGFEDSPWANEQNKITLGKKLKEKSFIGFNKKRKFE